jgi:phospholipase C
MPEKTNTPPVKLTPVTNIFVLMLENHSFDNMFAMSGIPGIRVATTKDSNSYNGREYNVRNDAPWCMPTDPGHEFLDVVEQLCGTNAAAEYAWKYARDSNYFVNCDDSKYPEINLSGFVSNYATSKSEGTGQPLKKEICDVMACFNTPRDLPVIYQLAKEFAICDHWFSSLPGPTWPNRFFVHGASSSGMDRSPNLKEEVEWETVHGFEYANKSIFQALSQKKYGWRLYQDKENVFTDNKSSPLQGGWISQVASLKDINLWDIHSLTGSKKENNKFKEDLHKDDGKHYRENYPYTFIEPNFGASFFAKQNKSNPGPTYKGGSSQHPEDNPYGGEALIKFVYETIFNSPLCDTSLLIIMYDEHGGFYDSVEPPSVVPPGDKVPESQKNLNSYCFDFSQLGVRVPAVVVSPLIPKGKVDSKVYDHSSILATLERKLGLDPLTERDKHANDLWDLLSLSEARQDIPKQLNNPSKIHEPKCLDPDMDLSDKLLPERGNHIGFLLVLLKAELKLAELKLARWPSWLRFLFRSLSATYIKKEFSKITTHGQASAYVAKIKHLIDQMTE